MPRRHTIPRVTTLIIHPKVRGFICTTTHPLGCELNVRDQIAATRAQGVRNDGPKKVLVIGASSGYGLAARISAAFGFGADTLGVFFEKPGSEKKAGTAGWYNSAAFDKFAKEAGLYSKSINGDAFSDEARAKVIELIKTEMGGQVDLVVYSLASPVRKLPTTGEVKRSALKPIGAPYTSTAIDTNKDAIVQATIEPATEQEIEDTVTVMGGQDWELWIDALDQAGVLADGARTVAFSYIGRHHLADLLARRAGARQGGPGPDRAAPGRAPAEDRRHRECGGAEIGGDAGQFGHPGDAAVHQHRVQGDEGTGPA